MAEPTKSDALPRSVMEEPSTQAVARVYAKALLDAAASTVGVEAALEEFRSFQTDVMQQFPEFRRLILSSALGRKDQADFLRRVLSGRASEFFVNFLNVLVRHDRISLLPQILHESERLFETQSGKRRVQVRSAVPLTPELQARISESLQAQMGFQPILELKVDPSLLGGLIIRVGDTVYDSSLRTRLQQLRGRFSQRKLHEIQSGRDRFSHPA